MLHTLSVFVVRERLLVHLHPSEGKTLIDMMNAYLSAHEYAELSERIAELEEAAPRGGKRW